MKVGLVSTHDCKGGAAQAAFRLHQGLLKQNVASTLFCRWKHSELNSVRGLYDEKPVWSRLTASAESFRIRLPAKRYRIDPRCDLFSPPQGPCRSLPTLLQDFDAVNLHWTSAMVDLPTFFEMLPAEVPVVWTLHDMATMTGGCHYDNDCESFTVHCGSCPALHSEREEDLAYRYFSLKQSIFESIHDDRLTIIAPSRWMAQKVSGSRLLRRFKCHRIPYGLDTNRFSPRPETDIEWRSRNGIASGDFVILFVAESVSNVRKGFDLLERTIELLSKTVDVRFVAVGNSPPGQASNDKTIYLGHIDEPSEMASVYSAADVFVVPSRQDNLPNTILESMACGTPVVAFDVGGIPDMVRPGHTGELAEPGSPKSLAACIHRLIHSPETRAAYSRRCREVAVADYDLDVQATAYHQLFKSLASARLQQ